MKNVVLYRIDFGTMYFFEKESNGEIQNSTNYEKSVKFNTVREAVDKNVEIQQDFQAITLDELFSSVQVFKVTKDGSYFISEDLESALIIIRQDIENMESEDKTGAHFDFDLVNMKRKELMLLGDFDGF